MQSNEKKTKDRILERLELLIEENIRDCGENTVMCHDRNFGVRQAIEIIKSIGELSENT